MEKYCVIGPVACSPYTRYGIVERGVIVSVQVSLPDGELVPSPMKYARKSQTEVQIKQYRINEAPAHNGEQPRRTTWRRSGKRAEVGL